MAALDDLQEQIEQLRQELERFREEETAAAPGGWRVRRGVPFGLLLVGLLLAAAWPGLQAAQDKDKKEDRVDEIVCSRLRILGKGGVELIEASDVADKEGGHIKVNGHDGKQRLFAGVGLNKGGGAIGLRDRDMIYRTVWQVGNNGIPSLTMINRASTEELYVGSSDAVGGGYVNLNNAKGTRQIILSINNDRIPVFGMYNAKGKREVSLSGSVGDLGGLINVNGPEGDSRAILDVDNAGAGRVSLYDPRRFLETEIGSDPKGGRILLSGRDARDVLYVGTNDRSRSGEITLSSARGRDLIRLGVAEGKLGGVIDLRDEAFRAWPLHAGFLEALNRRLKLRGVD